MRMGLKRGLVRAVVLGGFVLLGRGAAALPGENHDLPAPTQTENQQCAVVDHNSHGTPEMGCCGVNQVLTIASPGKWSCACRSGFEALEVASGDVLCKRPETPQIRTTERKANPLQQSCDIVTVFTYYDNNNNGEWNFGEPVIEVLGQYWDCGQGGAPDRPMNSPGGGGGGGGCKRYQKGGDPDDMPTGPTPPNTPPTTPTPPPPSCENRQPPKPPKKPKKCDECVKDLKRQQDAAKGGFKDCETLHAFPNAMDDCANGDTLFGRSNDPLLIDPAQRQRCIALDWTPAPGNSSGLPQDAGQFCAYSKPYLSCVYDRLNGREAGTFTHPNYTTTSQDTVMVRGGSETTVVGGSVTGMTMRVDNGSILIETITAISGYLDNCDQTKQIQLETAWGTYKKCKETATDKVAGKCANAP